jgi:thiol-disulfide isomerase/thioredoxin
MRIGSTYVAIVTIVVCIAVGIAGYFALRTTPQPAPLQRQQEVIVGKVIVVAPPRPAPALSFIGGDGKKRTLADFRGHWLLMNLWATWCAPCIKEMPSLGRLQAALGPVLDVVAISEDRTGAKAVDPFVATLDVKSLPLGLDPAGDVASALHVQGLPTTFLIDPQGRIVAQLEGAAEWDGATMLTTLRGLMTEPRG